MNNSVANCVNFYYDGVFKCVDCQLVSGGICTNNATVNKCANAYRFDSSSA